jgi:hypothetical protein
LYATASTPIALALPVFFAHTSTWIRCALMIWYEPQPSTEELAAGTVNVPELLLDFVPELLGLLEAGAGLLLLDPVAGLVLGPVAGLLALGEPPAELAGAEGEPLPLLAGALPEPVG